MNVNSPSPNARRSWPDTLYSEDERSSDDSQRSVSPGLGARYYAYERAGGFKHDQSVYGEPRYGDPKRKPFSYLSRRAHASA
eukprot:2605425-Pleurochrysis_carterae.AAC.1